MAYLSITPNLGRHRQFQPVGLLPLVSSVVVGAASFSAVGVALTVIIRSEKAAPAVTNALTLPLRFIGDIFIISSDRGPAVGGITGLNANLFPVKHLGVALTESSDLVASEVPFPVEHWLVVLGRGAFG